MPDIDVLFAAPPPGTPAQPAADHVRQLCHNVAVELAGFCPPGPHTDAAVQALTLTMRHAQAALRGDHAPAGGYEVASLVDAEVAASPETPPEVDCDIHG